MEKLAERCTVISRRLIADERGWFLKVITGTEEGLPLRTGEFYVTMGKKGQNKGGHYHPKAVEWFTIISGKAILKLEDVFTKERIEIELSLEKAVTVFVPNNVAHIVCNNSNNDFILLAYTNQLYDPCDTIAYQFQ